MLNNKQFALLHAAIALQKQGQLVEAAQAYAELRTQLPREFDPFYLGGMVALQLNRAEEAAPLLQQACALSPKHHEAAFHLGSAFVQQGKLADAEKPLRLAIQQKPDYAEALAQLGHVLTQLDRTDEALSILEKAVLLSPKKAELWCNIGQCHAARRQGKQAMKAYDTALSLDPEHPEACFSRAGVLLQMHRAKEALVDLDRHLAKHPAHRDAWSSRLLALHYLGELSPAALFEEHLKFGKLLDLAEAEQDKFREKRLSPSNKDRKLRVAFLSADLKIQPQAFFLLPILANLDRERFDLFLYYDHAREDGFSAIFKRYARCWRNIASMPDSRVETIIQGDSPDILFDLAGHTRPNRLALFARRQAPLQISYLGYPDTTGLRSMDYRFTDAVADPEPEADAFYTEKLVRFSSCAWAYMPPPMSPPTPPASTPRSAGIVFGSLCPFTKIGEQSLDLWSRLLSSVPGSQLLLLSPGPEEAEILKIIESRGIEASRVRFLAPPKNATEHLTAYSRMDLCLDSYPFHNPLSVCEALWMGVPVICLHGDRHCSRMSSSILKAIGHEDWVASNPEEYVGKAMAMTADRTALSKLRSTLRGEMQASILLDGKAQAARFGEALLSLWSRACDQNQVNPAKQE